MTAIIKCCVYIKLSKSHKGHRGQSRSGIDCFSLTTKHRKRKWDRCSDWLQQEPLISAHSFRSQCCSVLSQQRLVSCQSPQWTRPLYHGAHRNMDIVLSLVSLTVTKVLQFSGLVDKSDALRTKKMEEKALEVYGERAGLSVTRPNCPNCQYRQYSPTQTR